MIQEQCYDNIRISRNAWDTNLVKVYLLSTGADARFSNITVGESQVYLSQLGSQWRRRFRGHSDQSEGASTRTTTTFQGTYCCGLGYGLVVSGPN